jgi:hypothetical protein
MKPLFHRLQAAAYDRAARKRVQECLGTTLPSRRRWLIGEIANLRRREAWHAARVNELCSPEIEACAAAVSFYARRAAVHRCRAERISALDWAAAFLREGGALLAAEMKTPHGDNPCAAPVSVTTSVSYQASPTRSKHSTVAP